MANSVLIYNSLPTNIQLRVGANPNITSAEWCGYTPNKYTIPVFLRGIYKEVYMASVAELKATINNPLLSRFIEDDPEAFLGDGFRHIEPGVIFPEEYEDIDEADVPIGPRSGHHLNIITETDRTIEKWYIRTGHTRDEYARYFKDYSSFQQFLNMLTGNLMNGIMMSLEIIMKAVLIANPTKAVLDSKDFARIFKKVKGATGATPPTSKLALKYTSMMEKLINKYYGKSVALWKNYKFYNPFFYSYDNSFEKGNPKEYYENILSSGKDIPKIHMQQRYTVAHEQDGEEDAENTNFIHHLHRNDCLFALFDAIDDTVTTLTTQRSSEYWLGKEGMLRVYNTQEEILRKHQELLDGHPIPMEQTTQSQNADTSASTDNDFEVAARREDLVVVMNKDDYRELKRGVARRGQMDVRAVNLDMLNVACFPLEDMEPGCVRILDDKAFKIRPYFQMFDTQEPAEKLAWRYLLHYQFAVIMFKNFGGCMWLPTPHFVASPNFYNTHNLLGQPVEKKK